jgi:hypothetical protein
MSQHEQDNDPNVTPRRHFLKLAAGTAAVAAVAGTGMFARTAQAKSLPPLSESDPMAKALHYTDDASTTKDPKHEKNAICGNCSFYHGKSGAKSGPCDIFPGHSVAHDGWCVSHQFKKKS